jgi:hypothetical protein
MGGTSAGTRPLLVMFGVRARAIVAARAQHNPRTRTGSTKMQCRTPPEPSPGAVLVPCGCATVSPVLLSARSMAERSLSDLKHELHCGSVELGDSVSESVSQ